MRYSFITQKVHFYSQPKSSDTNSIQYTVHTFITTALVTISITKFWKAMAPNKRTFGGLLLWHLLTSVSDLTGLVGTNFPTWLTSPLSTLTTTRLSTRWSFPSGFCSRPSIGANLKHSLSGHSESLQVLAARLAKNPIKHTSPMTTQYQLEQNLCNRTAIPVKHRKATGVLCTRI